MTKAVSILQATDAAPCAREHALPKSELHARLIGMKVCHLSPIQRLQDERAFSRESLPVADCGLRSVIVGPHSRSGIVQNVEFIPTPKSKTRARRPLATLRILHCALKQRANIYHIHNPELIPVGLVLKFVFKKTVVYDTREDFPSMMLTKTYLPRRLRRLASRAVAAIERLATRLLDGVITADSGSLRPLAKIGRSEKLVFYNFPNLINFANFESPQKSYDLVYRGGLSARSGTFVLLDALRLLLDRGIPARLLLFGYADDRQSEQAITQRLHTLGLQHLVTLWGLIPHSKMAATLSRARISVCPLLRIPKFMNNIPVKVFESWACGLPVIATDLPPIRPFFGARGIGLLVKPGDPQDLAKAIRHLLDAPELIEEYGRRARQMVLTRYNAAMEIHKLVALYGEVLSC